MVPVLREWRTLEVVMAVVMATPVLGSSGSSMWTGI